MTVRAEQIKLRAVAPPDDDFLLSLYSSTRAEELRNVPWTAEQKEAFVKMQFAAQIGYYAAAFPQANHDLIILDEASVGRIYLDRGRESLHILDITVLPQYRNQGIGSTLLDRLLAEAGPSGKAVTIYVETFNPSLRFFERLGFQKAEQKDYQLLMKWQPKA